MVSEALEFHLKIDLPQRCIDGHFPGRPLVPGAALCAALAQELEQRLRRPVIGVAKLRFSAPVQPGAELVITAQQRSESQWRLRVAAAGREAFRGLFKLGEVQ